MIAWKTNSLPAFRAQSKKQLSAPKFTGNVHGLKLTGASLGYILLLTAWRHSKKNTSCSSHARMHPGTATTTVICFPAPTIVLTPPFVIFLHAAFINSLSPSQPGHLLPLSCYYSSTRSAKNCQGWP